MEVCYFQQMRDGDREKAWRDPVRALGMGLLGDSSAVLGTAEGDVLGAGRGPKGSGAGVGPGVGQQGSGDSAWRYSQSQGHQEVS